MNRNHAPSKPRFARRSVRALVALAALVVTAFCLIGVYAVLASVLLHGAVNERSLFRSVSGVAGSPFPDVGGPCEKVRESSPDVWSCAISDSAGSGSVWYRVTVPAQSSCWEATLVLDRSEGGMPKTLSGCVRRLQWPAL